MQNDIREATNVLKRGGVILYPTDTIWGIGCDATNPEAVQRVFQIKQRNDAQSMLVLMENPALLNRYVNDVPEIAWDLAELSTTPLTIIFPGAKNLADNLIAKDGSIGIRITTEIFTVKLLQQFRRPVVSTSANVSGEKFSGIFDDISEKIKSRVDYIVNYRQNDINPAQPSSIIKLWPDGRIDIVRK